MGSRNDSARGQQEEFSLYRELTIPLAAKGACGPARKPADSPAKALNAAAFPLSELSVASRMRKLKSNGFVRRTPGGKKFDPVWLTVSEDGKREQHSS